MGLIDNKKKVFNTIGAYSSMMQTKKMPDETNLFPSVNNKKDVVPYLLDVLKVVAGSFAIKQLVGQLFTGFIDKAEPELKKTIKKQTVQFNSGDGIPNFNYKVPVKQIDVYGKLKTSPDSTAGDMLYNKDSLDFDTTAYQAILNDSVPTNFGNLSMGYDSDSDSFNFSPNISPNSGVPNIGDWTGQFVDNMTIINKKEFMSNVMDSFYGSITKSQNKTVEQVAQELEINKLLDQLINDDDSFVIPPEEYDALQQKAIDMVNGVVYYDMGCGVMGAVLPLSGMSNLISSISGSTDPNYISNKIGDTIDESVVDKETASNNNETIKDNFFQRIIKLITQQLAKAVCTTPQIRTLLAITGAFQNNGQVVIKTIKQSLEDFKIYLKCLIKMAMEMINKFIYEFILGFLMAMISPIIKKVIKEKINQFVGIMKSLVASKAPNTG